MMNKTELDYAAMGILFFVLWFKAVSWAFESVIFTPSWFRFFHSDSFCARQGIAIPSWRLTSH
jgi:hypothetical protein